MINTAAPPVGQAQPAPVAAALMKPAPANEALPMPGQGPAEPVANRPAASERPPEPRVQFDPQKLQENLKEAIEQLNKQLADSGRTLGFRMDDVLNSPVVTVKSTKTGEVIRQIPSEAVIKAAHTFDQLKGLLVDEAT